MIKISVLVPVFNEEKTVLEILRKVKLEKHDGFEFEVIVIDDGSRDRSVELLKANPDLYSKLIVSTENGGKGAAVRKGLDQATGDYILFQDADLEYDPTDYKHILLPIKKFQADVVIGSRFLAPTYTRVIYFWHKMGNRLITLMFNLMNNTTFTDIYSCYFLFRRKLVPSTDLITNGWDQQAEILTMAVKRSSAHFEVPINYYGRTYEDGKKIRAHHIFSVFKAIFLTRFYA